MSAVLSFAEIDGQRVELLPARTVLSLFSAGGGCGCTTSASGTSAGATGTGTGQGITTGAGGPGKGEASFNEIWTYIEDGNATTNVIGGAGGAGGAVS
jgi:hypothetical protein